MHVNKIILFLIFFTSSALAQNVDQQKTQQDLVEKNLPLLTKQVDKISENIAGSAAGSDSSQIKSRLLDGINAISLISKAPSLMFESDEKGNVERAVESLKTNQVYTPEIDISASGDKNGADDSANKSADKKSQESEKSYIYLSSIIYFGPDNWVVWVNNQKFTPKTNPKEGELYLREVENDRVRLLWTLSMSKWRIISGQKNDTTAPKVNDKNQVEVDFELHPNQTFILSQNIVVEGRAVINLSRKREKERDERSKLEKAAKNVKTKKDEKSESIETTEKIPDFSEDNINVLKTGLGFLKE
jgi:hypothetical protein